jgi:hypothetical protein
VLAVRRLAVMVVLLGGCGTGFEPGGWAVTVAPDSGGADSDAGGPDAGSTDAGSTDGGSGDGGASDAGSSDAGTGDAGSSDGGTTDAGASDAGTGDAGLGDAGTSDAGAADAGTSDAGAVDGGADAGFPWGADGGAVASIRFGGNGGFDGLWNGSPVDPNLRTVAGWFRLRVTSNNRIQEVAWSIENNPPSTNYHLMVTTFHQDQWESHDKLSAGFLFAPVDLGWWFVAEANNTSGPRTALYWKKAGAATLNVTTGNTHLPIFGMTRFLVGTDDATGQNEWFDGDMAGLRVWSAELSRAELELEANHVNPQRTADLHAWYPLQDLATMRQDYSGNARHLMPIVDGGVWSVQPGPAVDW